MYLRVNMYIIFSLAVLFSKILVSCPPFRALLLPICSKFLDEPTTLHIIIHCKHFVSVFKNKVQILNTHIRSLLNTKVSSFLMNSPVCSVYNFTNCILNLVLNAFVNYSIVNNFLHDNKLGFIPHTTIWVALLILF